MNNLVIVAVAVIILSTLVFFVTREGFRSDKTNTAFNNSPRFWNWKNIKS